MYFETSTFIPQVQFKLGSASFPLVLQTCFSTAPISIGSISVQSPTLKTWKSSLSLLLLYKPIFYDILLILPSEYSSSLPLFTITAEFISSLFFCLEWQPPNFSLSPANSVFLSPASDWSKAKSHHVNILWLTSFKGIYPNASKIEFKSSNLFIKSYLPLPDTPWCSNNSELLVFLHIGHVFLASITLLMLFLLPWMFLCSFFIRLTYVYPFSLSSSIASSRKPSLTRPRLDLGISPPASKHPSNFSDSFSFFLHLMYYNNMFLSIGRLHFIRLWMPLLGTRCTLFFKFIF